MKMMSHFNLLLELKVMLIVLVLSYVNRGVDMPKSVDVKVLVALRMSSQKMYV